MKVVVKHTRRTRARHWLAAKLSRLSARLYGYSEIESVDVDCGYNCADIAPYGFVPECGCPIHDPED